MGQSAGQIIFDGCEAESDLLFRAIQADSAIRTGEFGEVHSLLIVENGRCVYEEYYNGWTRDSLHQLQSATKSVVATLLGCAIQRDLVDNVRESVLDYFPEKYFPDARKRSMLVEDLLTQRHGLQWKETPWNAPDNTWRRVLSSEGDWYEMILEMPMDTAPGSVFNYSNAAPVLVCGIIQNASDMRIDDFAVRHLFTPLGIERYWFWPGNGGPQNNGMALISLTSRDMAKIGQLYLQRGVWNDKQIIPESYIEDATSAQVQDVESNGFYSSYDYGYFWWSDPVLRNANKDTHPHIYLARGAGGQNIIVWPDRNTVVVITAWNLRQSNKPQVIFDRYLAVESP